MFQNNFNIKEVIDIKKLISIVTPLFSGKIKTINNIILDNKRQKREYSKH